MLIASLMSTQRSAASVIFAIAIIPILGLCGLAVDYGIWARIDSEMTMAANTAALNAVKIAATAEVNKDPNAVAEGNQTGAAWFNAEAGGKQPYMAGIVTTSVTTTVGPVVSANVSFSGSIYSIFGKLFGVRTFPISGQVAASENIASFSNIEIILDNSPSMAIGASDGSCGINGNGPATCSIPPADDINTLEQLSPCWPTNALYQQSIPTMPPTHGKTAADPYYPNGFQSSVDAEFYQNYQYANQPSGNNYTGVAPSPVVRTLPPALTLLPAATFVQTPYNSSGILQDQNGYYYQDATIGTSSCAGAGVKLQYKLPGTNTLAYPRTGPPCAFACHFDNSGKPTSQGNDLYAMARQNNVTLRFDLVKAATKNVIQEMQQYDLSNNNLNVGIFSFDQIAHQHYPVITNPTQIVEPPAGVVPPCETNGMLPPLNEANPQQLALEAGHNWQAAIDAVGGYNGFTDLGIPPVVALLQGVNKGPAGNDDTAIANSIKCLASGYLSPVSSDAKLVGRTAQTPAKFLFLITDGYEDNGITGRQPLDPNACKIFSDPVSQGGLGYTVFVIYTPYYQVKHQFFFQYMYTQVVPLIGSPLYTALQSCASDPQNDFVAATNLPELDAALSKFLRAALNKVARFNM
jgi:hypothetical protein